jgi:adenylosuccinate synthase
VVTSDGEKKVSYHLPIGAVMCKAKIILTATSLINLDILEKEISDLGIDPERVVIDPRASIITSSMINREVKGGMSNIGSTLQGIGECRVSKMARNGQHTLAIHEASRLRNMGVTIYTIPASRWIEIALDNQKMVLCEGTQGFDLDLEHGIHHRYCFARGTRVLLADGTSERIEKIVRDRMDVEVLSVNKSSGAMEPKKITNWYKTPHDGEWYRVHTTMSPGDKSSVKCTGDHKWITHNGEVPARDLVEGDILYTDEPDIGSRPAQIKCTGVEKIPPLVGAGYRVKYNIEVADNHNYFAGNQFGYSLVGNCTSKMINPSMMMAEAGVPPRRVGDIYGVIRPYPIRVNNRTGTSGPYAEAPEITWDEVAERCGFPGSPDQFGEITTTTKLPRRVFEFCWSRFDHFVRVCGPTKLCLQFANYIDWSVYGQRRISEPIREFIHELENFSGVPVMYVGTGPDHDSMVEIVDEVL